MLKTDRFLAEILDKLKFRYPRHWAYFNTLILTFNSALGYAVASDLIDPQTKWVAIATILTSTIVQAMVGSNTKHILNDSNNFLKQADNNNNVRGSRVLLELDGNSKLPDDLVRTDTADSELNNSQPVPSKFGDKLEHLSKRGIPV